MHKISMGSFLDTSTFFSGVQMDLRPKESKDTIAEAKRTFGRTELRLPVVREVVVVSQWLDPPSFPYERIFHKHNFPGCHVFNLPLNSLTEYSIISGPTMSEP